MQPLMQVWGWGGGGGEMFENIWLEVKENVTLRIVESLNVNAFAGCTNGQIADFKNIWAKKFPCKSGH